MPELPEVETIKRGLEQTGLIGRRIQDAEVKWHKSLQASGDNIDRYLRGAKVERLRRFGKVLIIDLDSGYSLLIHLKMTGQLVYDRIGNSESGIDGSSQDSGFEILDSRFAGGHPTESMSHKLPDKSTRVIFTLDGGGKLFFNDQRKFGWIKLVPTAEVGQDSLLARMGPDVLSDDFTVEYLKGKLKSRGVAVKTVIMDQAVAAGVGNIYADEALFLAGIHPQHLAQEIKPEQVKKLHHAIKAVLLDSINLGGTSFTNYVNALGLKGNFLEYANVFRKEGRPCPICGTPIEKIRVNGRGTHFCPNHQPFKESK